jgi:hypothetical protein
LSSIIYRISIKLNMLKITFKTLSWNH